MRTVLILALLATACVHIQEPQQPSIITGHNGCTIAPDSIRVKGVLGRISQCYRPPNGEEFVSCYYKGKDSKASYTYTFERRTCNDDWRHTATATRPSDEFPVYLNNIPDLNNLINKTKVSESI